MRSLLLLGVGGVLCGVWLAGDVAPGPQPQRDDPVPQPVMEAAPIVSLRAVAEHRVEIPPPQRTAESSRRRVLVGGKKSVVVCPAPESDWLSRHQDEDGGWDAARFDKHDAEVGTGAGVPAADLACTSLAVLAFLGDGSTMRSGPNRGRVKAGVRWLIRRLDQDGCFRGEAGVYRPRDQALATYALCEAGALSSYKILRKYAQRALGHLVGSADLASGRDGLLFLGWRVRAYAAAARFDLRVPGDGIARDLGLILSHRHAAPDLVPALELTCRLALGQDSAAFPEVQAAAEDLCRRPPSREPGGLDLDRCVFASLALYQLGGEHWKTWSRQLTQAVVRQQRSGQGPERGSWDPVGPDAGVVGRVYATAAMMITVEAYYRYSRLVR